MDDYLDIDYDVPSCEKCGKPLTGDSDGDGVWATPVYFCEHCPDEDDHQVEDLDSYDRQL